MIRRHCVLAFFAVAAFPSTTLKAQHLIRKWHGELTYDQFGESVAMLGDVDADGACDVAVGSTHPAGTNEGAVYVYSGSTGALIRRIDGVQQGEGLGIALAPLNDVDGDGVPDLAIGAPWWFEPGGWDGGRVCVYSGATGSLVWYQPSQGRQCRLGITMARVGDLDGDGVDDFVAGAPAYDIGLYEGAAYVFSGKTGTILFTWIGDEPALGLGNACSEVGDADGDGVADVAVGAELAAVSDHDRGRVYLYSGKDGTLLQSWTGTIDNAHFGRGMAPMGDLNGDGCADLAIGSYQAPQNQAMDVFLYSGKDGVLIDTIHGTRKDDSFGQALANAGDLDGDGFPELLIGAPDDSTLFTSGGSVHVVSGRTRRELYRFDAEGGQGFLGKAVAGGQDVDGDAVPDFLAGAQYAPKGRAYLYGGNDLFLEGDPADAAPLTTLTLSTRAAAPGSLALMTLEELDGAPMFQMVQLTTLDSNGEWILSAKVPSGLTGHQVGLRTYAQKDPTLGGVLATDLTYMWFQ